MLKLITGKWCTSVVTLYLDIFITRDNKLASRAYKKELNLYMYVPHHSSHPRGMLHVTIMDGLECYRDQHTYTVHYIHFSQFFFTSLFKRAHTYHILWPLFKEVTQSIDNSTNVTRLCHLCSWTTSYSTAIFCYQFHQHGSSNFYIHSACESTCNCCLTTNNV